ncbi:TrpR-related protein YerC/YecD [Natronobacillus azotifigens]|uniref:YerC/YecD family TrpR-related protein n=1 Tax=Natronobacillus azotifigens TaxID=472978 RepID=A0A9J6RC01_9BACI|nr:YerC/YecD family TrpR-related protein [Natronobacillus azotifigens]MCZ0702886.1 YerC/YecD family TrpR-related protein [Natronobacillus azotifigens]
MQIDKLRGEQLDELFDAILSLKDREECYRFFDDIATMSEITSLAQRLLVAKMLNEGRTYHAIVEESSASTTTISRVKRCLTYGNDGYKMVLERLEKNEPENEQE